ncbi:MAG TPA: hypothetical protein VK897_19780 [Anaerolineales bacterium]|nr:hypothetical protein [Anaerolineales bacterium]
MTIDDLAQKCAQETNLYFARQDSDSTYCFELFRRAISERDDLAWKVLVVQYEPMVTKWVNKWTNQHPNFPLAATETEDFIAEAFERFWKHFTPEKLSRSQSLDAILQYLKMCVHGATSDIGRKMRYRLFDQGLEGPEEGQESDLAEPESTPEERLQKEELWRLIRKKSKDEKEYIVIYASFSLALTPREILAEYPGKFRDIKEIYQCKANLLERLGRDTDLMEFVLG